VRTVTDNDLKDNTVQYFRGKRRETENSTGAHQKQNKKKKRDKKTFLQLNFFPKSYNDGIIIFVRSTKRQLLRIWRAGLLSGYNQVFPIRSTPVFIGIKRFHRLLNKHININFAPKTER